MKKFVLIICLALLTTGVFAQKTIEAMNGYDWVTYSQDARGGMVQGFYLACSMIFYMSYELSEPTMNREQLSQLSAQLDEKFMYPGTVGDMVNKLDAYYASPSNRKYPIFRTIPYLAGREWWNRQTGKVDVPAPAGPGS